MLRLLPGRMPSFSFYFSMTCTGCSRKVTNASIKVTFVTGLYLTVLNLLQLVLPHTEETGFKILQIVSNYQVLDLTIDPDLAKDASEQLQDIIESIEKIDNRFTASTIIIPHTMALDHSARLSRQCVTLAPPGKDGTLADSRRRLTKVT